MHEYLNKEKKKYWHILGVILVVSLLCVLFASGRFKTLRWQNVDLELSMLQ